MGSEFTPFVLVTKSSMRMDDLPAQLKKM
jgi:hypothetical protein